MRAWWAAVWLAIGLASAVGCGGGQKTSKGKPVRKLPPGVQEGMASWYGGKHHGGPTASGERFNKNAMTAAHRYLKMNTRVRVTNKRNGRTVEVRINDRGPYSRGRIIDLSEAAAKQIDMIDAGVVPVRVEVLK
jgi:rare lipoprotein A